MSDSDRLDSHCDAAGEAYETAAYYASIHPVLPFCPRWRGLITEQLQLRCLPPFGITPIHFLR
jgi:hypothetical protein